MEGNGNKKIRQARSLAGKKMPAKRPLKPADPREFRPYMKKPGYRGTKYNEEMKAKAEYCGMMGFGIQQTADFLEVSSETLRNYRRQYPDFDLSVRRGILLANAKVVRKLFQVATEEGDVAACKYWLQSRGGSTWNKDEAAQRPLIGDIIMPGGQKTVNTVVTGVVEIIQRRVKDKETVALIAQDIRELAERQSGSNGSEQVVEGEVVDDDAVG